jgi:hypothetical protein
MDINKILRANMRNCSRGAPMGDSNFRDTESRLYLQAIRFVEGDYAPDATYWGGGFGSKRLYCAFNGEDADFAPAMGARIYVRAKNRAEAKREISEMYPDAKFYR